MHVQETHKKTHHAHAELEDTRLERAGSTTFVWCGGVEIANADSKWAQRCTDFGVAVTASDAGSIHSLLLAVVHANVDKVAV